MMSIYWTGCVMVGINLYNPVTTVEIIFSLGKYIMIFFFFGLRLNPPAFFFKFCNHFFKNNFYL
jgi:hypothetical protein